MKQLQPVRRVMALRGRTVLTSSFLSAVAMLFAGCGSSSEGPELAEVSGVVTIDGTPVPEGRILFRRTDGDRKAFASEIRDGEYEVVTEPGIMAVEIIASRPVPGKFDTSNGTPEPVGEMYIPPKYNAQTILTAQVDRAGSNEFPFELSSN